MGNRCACSESSRQDRTPDKGRISFARTRFAEDWLALAYDADTGGDLARAEVLYQYAIIRDVNCWQAAYNLGILLFRQGRLGPAERCFRHVLKARENTHYRSFNMLGIINYSRGEVLPALEWFLRAAKANPYYPQTWTNLSLAFNDLGRDDLARKARRKYFEVNDSIRLYAEGKGEAAESTLIAFEAMIGVGSKTA